MESPFTATCKEGFPLRKDRDLSEKREASAASKLAPCQKKEDHHLLLLREKEDPQSVKNGIPEEKRKNTDVPHCALAEGKKSGSLRAACRWGGELAVKRGKQKPGGWGYVRRASRKEDSSP